MAQETPFVHRGWGIRVWNAPDEFDEVVERAVREAPAYGITTLDLHDGVIPPGIGWIPLFSHYRQVQALRGLKVLTYQGYELTEEVRDEYRARFRNLCRMIRAGGLRIHVWYHVLRDLPEEWLAAEQTLSRLEGRRLWQVVGSMLEDFFLAVPEVDALTVTAHQAIATNMRDPSSVTPGERLRAIYQCIYEACRRHRRQMVIREAGYTPGEYETFIYAVGPLPPDIAIMLKDVQGDWLHVSAPHNPTIERLSGKTILLETDLYGEHWGQLELPLCRPREIHHLVRSWLPLKVAGAVGRIMVREQRHGPLIHIFDSPNEANVAAFSRLLKNPGRTIGDAGEWGDALEEFDITVWLDWIGARFGARTSPHLISALERTPAICQLTLYLGGAYFQHQSHLPEPSAFERRMWLTFTRQIKRIDIEVLRWEKEEALRLVRQSLRDVELAGPTINQADYELLLRFFEQSRDIILAYRAIIELCYGRLFPEHMPAATQEANDLAARVEALRGREFFGHLPERLRQLGQYLQDVTRIVPGGAETVPEEHEEELAEDSAFDIADLGVLPTGGEAE